MMERVGTTAIVAVVTVLGSLLSTGLAEANSGRFERMFESAVRYAGDGSELSRQEKITRLAETIAESPSHERVYEVELELVRIHATGVPGDFEKASRILDEMITREVPPVVRSRIVSSFASYHLLLYPTIHELSHIIDSRDLLWENIGKIERETRPVDFVREADLLCRCLLLCGEPTLAANMSMDAIAWGENYVSGGQGTEAERNAVREHLSSLSVSAAASLRACPDNECREQIKEFASKRLNDTTLNNAVAESERESTMKMERERALLEFVGELSRSGLQSKTADNRWRRIVLLVANVGLAVAVGIGVFAYRRNSRQ